MANILIVEDHQTILDLYTMAFEHASHKVTRASNGPDALRLASEGNFDIILLDILLPDLNGMHLLQSYKPLEHPATTVIITSNLDTPKLQKEAARLGVAEYVVKAKYTPKDIVAIAEKYLQK